MGLGAWLHRIELVIIGGLLEVLLWTAIPPVNQTFGFIEDVIIKELDWLNAPPSLQKSFSFVLLMLFPIVLLAGLWLHSWRLLGVSLVLILSFYFLMHRIAAKVRLKR